VSAAAPARRRPRSLIFRFVLLYTALFGVLVAGVLGLVYRATLAAHEDEADRAVDAEVQRLSGSLIAQRHRDGGGGHATRRSTAA
jgi:hypothetical protein